MSQYYLMSQLPSLDGISETTALPITEERFYELCARFLGKKTLNTLNKISLYPKRHEEILKNPLIDAWTKGERQLRLALAVIRAGKLGKTFDVGTEILSAELLQIARMATEMTDPLAAEKYLNRYRLEFLESIRPMDMFCDDAVFYYGLKLKLIVRMRTFDIQKGEDAYRNIYDSIISGAVQEATL